MQQVIYTKPISNLCGDWWMHVTSQVNA